MPLVSVQQMVNVAAGDFAVKYDKSHSNTLSATPLNSYCRISCLRNKETVTWWKSSNLYDFMIVPVCLASLAVRAALSHRSIGSNCDADGSRSWVHRRRLRRLGKLAVAWRLSGCSHCLKPSTRTFCLMERRLDRAFLSPNFDKVKPFTFRWHFVSQCFYFSYGNESTDGEGGDGGVANSDCCAVRSFSFWPTWLRIWPLAPWASSFPQPCWIQLGPLDH